jgi:hypothetical protein
MFSISDEDNARNMSCAPNKISMFLLNGVTFYSSDLLTSLPWAGFELTTLVVIDTDYICSCKYNYHTIMATTAPFRKGIEIKAIILENKIDWIDHLWPSLINLDCQQP